MEALERIKELKLEATKDYYLSCVQLVSNEEQLIKINEQLQGMIEKSLNLHNKKSDRLSKFFFKTLISKLALYGTTEEVFKYCDFYEQIFQENNNLFLLTLKVKSLSNLSEEQMLLETKKILTKIEKNGLVPDTWFYNEIFANYLNSNNVELAEDLLQDFFFKKYRLIPNEVTTFLFLEYYLKNQMNEKFIKFYNKFYLRHETKNLKNINSLFSHSLQIPNAEITKFLYSSLRDAKHISIHHYNLLISSEIRDAGSNNLQKLLENMKIDCIQPNLEFCESILRFYIKNNQTQAIKLIFQQLIFPLNLPLDAKILDHFLTYFYSLSASLPDPFSSSSPDSSNHLLFVENFLLNDLRGYLIAESPKLTPTANIGLYHQCLYSFFCFLLNRKQRNASRDPQPLTSSPSLHDPLFPKALQVLNRCLGDPSIVPLLPSRVFSPFFHHFVRSFFSTLPDSFVDNATLPPSSSSLSDYFLSMVSLAFSISHCFFPSVSVFLLFPFSSLLSLWHPPAISLLLASVLFFPSHSLFLCPPLNNSLYFFTSLSFGVPLPLPLFSVIFLSVIFLLSSPLFILSREVLREYSKEEEYI